jgi:hypothetical protein
MFSQDIVPVDMKLVSEAPRSTNMEGQEPTIPYLRSGRRRGPQCVGQPVLPS